MSDYSLLDPLARTLISVTQTSSFIFCFAQVLQLVPTLFTSVVNFVTEATKGGVFTEQFSNHHITYLRVRLRC